VAQRLLGHCYETGKGVNQDLAEAASWYRKAAEQGDVFSQVALGSLYAKGEGVQKDLAEAASWYRKSADQGNTIAQRSLAAAYLLGDGVPKDNLMAYMWSNIAAASGDDAGAKIRESASKEMTPEQIAKARQMSQEWKPRKESKRRRIIPLPPDWRDFC
jgi:hypothetical protein